MKNQLQKLIYTHAVQRGTFQMASGATSDLLIDLSKVLRRRDTQELLELYVPHKLYQTNYDAIGGPLCGSDLIAASLVRAGVSNRWFGVRKEAKGRGLDQGLITGELQPGDKVLLVEDVITTGGTADGAAEVVQAHGGILKGIFCVVDRGGLSYLAEKWNVPTVSLFTLEDFL